MAVQNQEEDDKKTTTTTEVKSENGKVKEEVKDEENNKTTTAAKDENNEEDDDESLKEDEEDEEQQGVSSVSANVGKKSFLGHTCSVKTLIDDNVLTPTNNALSFEFMGKTFYADLLANGGIRWTENKQTFSTPSSWVNFCKRTMTSEPINKSISAWSTIKYDGKRLDSYKLRWYRKQKKNFNGPNFISSTSNMNQISMADTGPIVHFDETNKSNVDLLKAIPPIRESLMSDIYFEDDPELDKKRNLVRHSDLPLKQVVGSESSIKLNCNQLVKTEPFSSIDRIQPFTITISTHALLLIDFHSHLTTTEVVGYLAGSWDTQTLNLSILKAFPCRIKIDDEQKAKVVQDEVIQNIRQSNLSLIGWYHNHYNRAAQPTIKDIECQLNYQLTMCESEIQYLPCVGLICSPYDPFNKDNSSSLIAYWTLPPPESKVLEYAKPLHLFYQTARDLYLTQDLLLEMRLLAHFYVDNDDKINFDEAYKDAKPNKDSPVLTYWDKLKYSIKPNLPSDLQVSNDLTPHQSNLQKTALQQFWTFLKGLLIKSTTTAPVATSTTDGSTTNNSNGNNVVETTTATAATIEATN